MNDFFTLLDDALHGQARLYRDYVRSDFLRAQDIARLDGGLAAAAAENLHAVLLADYAFGEALHGLDTGGNGVLAVHYFAALEVLDATQTAAWLAARDKGAPAGVAEAALEDTREDYLAAIAAIHAAIGRGETYQINYTTRLHLCAYGQPLALYRRLRERQRVPYGGLAYLPDAAGAAFALLSFSPELFVRIEDGLITAEPMKGTAPIVGDGADEARREALRNDVKNRAENVMIVDLLRNDLGKIALTGSVRVPQLFAVNAFGKVWQMTSTVQAALPANISAAACLQAVYPCGSITGAPKRKSMEIIRALEASPRGVYTGSLGFLEKNGTGFSGCLNVLIRSVVLREQAGVWQGSMGVGSGIVIDGNAEDEWAECAVKAAFVRDLPPTFGLIETMRFENGQCALFARHKARLFQAASRLGFAYRESEIIQAVQQAAAALPRGAHRVRLLLQADGTCCLKSETVHDLPETTHSVIWAETPLAANYLYRYKTDARQVYDAGLRQAQAAGAFDVLYVNAAGELLEGARSNVFVRLHGQWYTPPASLGILPGVMRAEILDNPQRYLGADSVQEKILRREEVRHADALVLSNAVRGVVKVGWQD
ncbi:MAG: chorismate-binding protein [Neisseria sp.]|nr:chorismate-binding protein [Neisseria sp.]